MPRYDFTCPTCGLTFERNLSIRDSQDQVRCPSGHKNVRRLYSAAAVVFRGPGFYATDHASRPSAADPDKSS